MTKTAENDEIPADGSPVAIVQEADVSDAVVVLKVRIPGRTATAIVAHTARGKGAGLLPRGFAREVWGGRLPPGRPKNTVRAEALVGARLLAISEEAIVFEPAGADAGGTREKLEVRGGRVVTNPAAPEAEGTSFVAVLGNDIERHRWEALGAKLAQNLADESLELRRATLVRMVDKARSRIERRREAIAKDLARVSEAGTIAAQAQWLIAEAARAPRGATKLVVTDWSSGEAVPIEVPLDPGKSAKDQVAAMFKRAKRLRLGERIAKERLEQTTTQLRELAAALESLETAPDLATMEEVARDAKRKAPRDVTLEAPIGTERPRAKGNEARRAFRTFVARSGRPILVGKGGKDNDELTLHVARPHDLWLHAKDRAGAHVVVRLTKGQTCSADDLVDAAHLAAHFSDARDEAIIDVQYTPRRYIRKPKGSTPGLVIVDREKVLVLRVDPATSRALLEREEL